MSVQIENIHACNGFTVLEVLTALILIAVLTGLGVPAFSGLSSAFDRANARAYVLQDLKRAQAESITKGCRGIVSIDADNTGYSFGCDYLAYDVAATPSADEVAFRRNLPTGITLAATGNIIFNSRGQAIDASYILNNVTLTLTDSQSGTANNFASGILTGSGVFTYN